MAQFGSLSDRLTETFRNLRTKGRLSPADVDGTVREIRRALLDADVALEVVKAFTAAVRERALSDEVNRALNPAQQVVQIVNEELVGILGGQQRRLEFAKKPPTVIMLAGLQGAGKTTLAGKLGKWLKKDGHTPMLVAADLQRPNAVQQLQVVGEQAGVHVFAPEPGNGVGDPVKVAKNAIKAAVDQQYDTVIVDTAGRLGVDAELMKQAANIRKAVDPDEVLFVIDAMIGQDAVTTARAFQEGVDFTGVVLSKLDGDARGGAALSVASVTGRPIMFASTGEGLDDFEPFHPDRMASRILDLGDILSLIEQAQGAFDEEEARKVADKIATDNFTLNDFLQQMQQLRKAGSIKGMLGMLPGAKGMREALDNFDEREIVRTEAIIQSMTPKERELPKLLNGSRRLRIAKGAGSTVTEVNQLVNRFEQAAKMMKTVARGGVPQMPGMGPIPGMHGGKKQQQGGGKKKSKVGNPAKRAAIAAGTAAAPQQAPQGSGLGLGGGAKGGKAPTEEELASLQKFLGR
ncbi:signal recognition particle subunit FFH/SRP54 (srp54) [Curtobacterium sp. PhB130]|uniref:signal recognition particle protein n=1 Tax=unclassified Curtobacterium TaxID=257496 RepID=UPI000F4B1BDF|nr:MULTISPECIES: signal recognition particle protein [unclassified Curtobacterium]ROP66540.1 signal recognition particle subunit FFH/SRP54 (srp54) [Curtobacterium sp. ZW137]ROS71997.1 signal recognition particle subunit FFH/SRP54 (srp54) [Curtobacterium sp. PhB130]TCK61416.1 signal recognition particle subunit FFH/SRP54 (srp54) [Curtobacterium sp. PhB136]